MRTLTFPTSIHPKSARAVIVPSGKAETNRYTGSVAVYNNGTAFWRLKLTTNLLKADAAFELDNLLVELDGHQNAVLLKDWNYKARGDWPGNIVVNGSNQEGTRLSVRGVTPNKKVAEVGDRFQIGNRMHQLTKAPWSNSAGEAVLQFQPKLLTIPTDGTALITDEPKCLYRWMNITSRPQFERHRRIMRGVDLVFEEVR